MADAQGDEQTDEQAGRNDGLDHSREQKVFAAPRGPIKREGVERADGGEGEEKDFQLER